MIGCSIFRWSRPRHPGPLVLQQWTSDFHISLNVARQQSSFSSISQHASFSRHGKVPSGGEFWRRTQLAGRDGGPVAREQPPLLFLLRWRRPPANGQAPPPSGWYSNCLATYSVITSCTVSFSRQGSCLPLTSSGCFLFNHQSVFNQLVTLVWLIYPMLWDFCTH